MEQNIIGEPQLSHLLEFLTELGTGRKQDNTRAESIRKIRMYMNRRLKACQSAPDLLDAEQQ